MRVLIFLFLAILFFWSFPHWNSHWSRRYPELSFPWVKKLNSYIFVIRKTNATRKYNVLFKKTFFEIFPLICEPLVTFQLIYFSWRIDQSRGWCIKRNISSTLFSSCPAKTTCPRWKSCAASQRSTSLDQGGLPLSWPRRKQSRCTVEERSRIDDVGVVRVKHLNIWDEQNWNLNANCTCKGGLAGGSRWLSKGRP